MTDHKRKSMTLSVLLPGMFPLYALLHPQDDWPTLLGHRTADGSIINTQGDTASLEDCFQNAWLRRLEFQRAERLAEFRADNSIGIDDYRLTDFVYRQSGRDLNNDERFPWEVPAEFGLPANDSAT